MAKLQVVAHGERSKHTSAPSTLEGRGQEIKTAPYPEKLPPFDTENMLEPATCIFCPPPLCNPRHMPMSTPCYTTEN